MALLYLCEDGVALDEQGFPWTCDDCGCWHPTVAPRPADLRLVTDEPRAEDPTPRRRLTSLDELRGTRLLSTAK
jgi:hypothetical protein